MYWELRKKMPEIIEKAAQKAVEEAVAEVVPKAVAEVVAETQQKERERFKTRLKQFCEKHRLDYTEEDWADETPENENK